MAGKFKPRIPSPSLRERKRKFENISRHLMRKHWPNFSHSKQNDIHLYKGEIVSQIYEISYKVEITFTSFSSDPKVRISDPVIPKEVPHLNSDGSLCLYKPTQINWSSLLFRIDSHIIPWTATWLYFYEVWEKTGDWKGPEAPH